MCPPLIIPARSNDPERKFVSALVWVVNRPADPAAMIERRSQRAVTRSRLPTTQPSSNPDAWLYCRPRAEPDVLRQLWTPCCSVSWSPQLGCRSILRGRFWRCISVHQSGRMSMLGEKDLDALLKNLSPALHHEEYVFVTLPGDYGDHADLKPVCSFREREGLALVVPKVIAGSHGLDTESVYRMITLEVHSSLDAVGLTAAVASRLAEEGISANVVAATCHDYVFVQSRHADRALQVLRDMGS